MTKRDLFSLVIQATGVLILVEYICSIPGVIQVMGYMLSGKTAGLTWPWGPVLEILSVVVGIVVGGTLVIKAESISKAVVRSNSDVAIAQWRDNEPIILGVVLQAMGVYFVVKAVPSILQIFVQSYLQYHMAGYSASESLNEAFSAGVMATRWSGIVSAVASLIIGCLLVYCAKYLVAFLYPNKGEQPVDNPE